MDRFLIAPINTGYETDLKPWLIPDDAFPTLENAYVFRGRIRKRFGSLLMGTINQSRFRINIGTTDVNGNIVFTTLPGIILKPGAQFTAGNVTFTVTTVPSVVGNAATLSTTSPFVGTVRLNSTGPNVYQFRITGGVAVITPVTVYFYPAEPVMGLTNYEVGPINNQPSYGFDTQFAYVWNSGWERSDTAGVPTWHGNNLNFFWTTNWRGIAASTTVMFVTNFFVVNFNGAGNANDDPIYSFDGTTWAVFRPIFLSGGNSVSTARIIVPFKDRLVLLNTVENTQADGLGTNSWYKNRARFSHNGSPFSTGAWLEPNNSIGGVNADGAGFIDATTEEQIISAEFIKDRLIVYFERSTWELAYTGNQILPFVWQKINTELGSEATFSTVPFDKEILTIGNVGVHSCNGANVARIDNKIPDQIFEIRDKNEGVKRVAGIRDYYVEMVYWTLPSSNELAIEIYPNRVLVYNYRNGSWSINIDTFTAFGYFEQQSDITWQTATTTWEESTFTWNSGVTQAQFRQVLAGNQQGWTVLIAPDVYRNCPQLQITNLVIGLGGNVTLTIIDHTLAVDEYIVLENLNGLVGPFTSIYNVVSVIDANTIVVYAPDITTGLYKGGGTAARVSNYDIWSKQLNPYVSKGQNVYLSKIDFIVQRTTAGQLVVDYYPSSTTLSMIATGTATNTIMGNNVLETSPYDPTYYPLETLQDRLTHPIYFQTEGNFIQINLYMNNDQITNPTIAWSGFELEGMVMHCMAISTRLQ